VYKESLSIIALVLIAAMRGMINLWYYIASNPCGIENMFLLNVSES
jgi:hypothetical protein